MEQENERKHLIRAAIRAVLIIQLKLRRSLPTVEFSQGSQSWRIRWRRQRATDCIDGRLTYDGVYVAYALEISFEKKALNFFYVVQWLTIFCIV